MTSYVKFIFFFNICYMVLGIRIGLHVFIEVVNKYSHNMPTVNDNCKENQSTVG